MQKYMHDMQKLCMWCTRVYFKNREIASGGTAHPYMYRGCFFAIVTIFFQSLMILWGCLANEITGIYFLKELSASMQQMFYK